MEYSKEYEIQWSEVDGNCHLGNSAYLKLATNLRYSYITSQGFDLKDFMGRGNVFVALREFVEYKRELFLGDKIIIDMATAGLASDASRWLIRHRFFREDTKKLCSVLHIETAWLDVKTRKICVPHPELYPFMENLARTKDFKVLDKRQSFALQLK